MKIAIDFYEEDGMGRCCEAQVLPVPVRLQKVTCALDAKRGGMRQWAYFHRAWVRADMRKLGLGRALLAEVAHYAKRMRVNMILRVAPFDCRGLSARKLIKLYGEFGFKLVDRKKLLMVRYA